MSGKPVFRRDPWGKFLTPDVWLPLSAHMEDVAACFAALVALPLFRARLVAAFGYEPSDVAIARLCVIAYLHDLGKLSSSFQAKAWDAQARGGHTAQGRQIFTVETVATALDLSTIVSWGDGAERLFLAALAHHGRPINGQDHAHAGDWRARDGYDPVVAARSIGVAVRARYPEAFAAHDGEEALRDRLPPRAELQHLFAGLVALADQLGSRTDDFPLDRAGASARDAAKVLRNLRLDVSELRALVRDIEPWRMFGWPGGAPAHPMQRALAELPLDIRLAVLEAETGSGKTEAAFLRFLKLFAAGLVDGLYFAVPTRAAASQIQGRIDRAARESFGGACVLALPGYLRVGDASGVPLPGWEVEWADEPDRAAREARWSAETPRRFLASAVAVGTIDQVLLAGLQVKWAHFRGAALSRSLLVVDEVHASDAYMTAILERMLRDHIALGGHALLMSATLGAAVRARLLGGARTKPDRHTDYPALSWKVGREPERHIATGHTGREKTVRVALRPVISDPTAIATLALEAARAGARVLVLRNTVDQVVAVHRAIEALDQNAPLLAVNGISAPHHGRYAAEDRRLLDRAVEALMGKAAPTGGAIVCASQTCEQSLDIDADFLISDLCPIDVLLQRIGRLHRHRRDDRPEAYSDARCVILTPERLEPDAGLLRFGLGANHEGSGVYPDMTGLEAVRRLVGEQGAQWTIPADNRRLVEAGTDPDTLDELARSLGDAWVEANGRRIGAERAQAQFARGVLLDRKRAFDGTAADCFPDEERILTRVGGDTLELDFPHETRGPFGTPISRIGVPGHWRVLDRVPDLATNGAAGWRRDLDMVHPAAGLIYDRFGLRKEFENR